MKNSDVGGERTNRGKKRNWDFKAWGIMTKIDKPEKIKILDAQTI